MRKIFYLIILCAFLTGCTLKPTILKGGPSLHIVKGDFEITMNHPDQYIPNPGMQILTSILPVGVMALSNYWSGRNQVKISEHNNQTTQALYKYVIGNDSNPGNIFYNSNNKYDNMGNINTTDTNNSINDSYNPFESTDRHDIIEQTPIVTPVINSVPVFNTPVIYPQPGE